MMVRKHASLIIAFCLIALVASACIIRTRPARSQRGQPVYVEKHKHQKHDHKKHKKHR
jgi:hypothetical protein